jgi:hypothetical protein
MNLWESPERAVAPGLMFNAVLPSYHPQSADNQSFQEQPSHRNHAILGEMGAGYEMWEEVEILGVGKALDDLDVSLESSSGSSNPSA